MNPILKNIVQQTGVDVRPLLPGREDEYLLTYDDKLQVCFSLNNNKTKIYYDSCAWSCGAACFITCDESHFYLNSCLLAEADQYEKDFVSDKWSTLFDYLKKYYLDTTKNVYDYFFKFLTSLGDELMSVENGMYLKVIESIWARNAEEISDDLGTKISSLYEGFVINGQRIEPDIDIVKRYVLPSISDIITLYLVPNNGDATIQSLSQRTYSGMGSGMISSLVFRILLKNNLRFNTGLDTLKVSLPLSLGLTYAYEVVKAIRSSEYEGRIMVNLNTIIDMPEYCTTFFERLLDDQNTVVNITRHTLFLNNWLQDQDLLITIPPYKLLGRIIQRVNANIELEQIPAELRNEKKMPFEIIKKACSSVSDSSTILIAVPDYSLKSEEMLQYRSEIDNQISIERIRSLGSYLFSMGMGSTTFMALKKSERADHQNRIKIHWCGEERCSFFDSMRAQNKKQNNACDYQDDDVEYNIPYNTLKLENWAPRRYSENELYVSIDERLRTKHLAKLSKLFTLYIGARTGLNQVFVITKEFFNQLPEPEKQYFCPSASSTTIKNGKLLDDRYVFYPYTEGLSISTENSLHRHFPFFSRVLINYKETLNVKKTNSKANWWDLSYHSSTTDPGKAKIIIPSHIKRGSFAYDQNGTFVVTGGYQLVPKKKTLSGEDVQYAYLAILHSSIFWKLIEIYCEPIVVSVKHESYRGTKQALDSIPVPDLSLFANDGRIEQLSEIGRAIVDEGTSSIEVSLLNEIVESLYYGNI